MANPLYYGDNLEVLRKCVKDETIDLCYIDPPFNSKRNYNQIYNNIGGEDRAQAQAFVDMWVWDTEAEDGWAQILSNHGNRFSYKTIELIKGLFNVLAKGSGIYFHSIMGRNYDRVQIVTVQEIIEEHKRLDIPMSLEVLRRAKAKQDGGQVGMEL